jgi:YVTN family beta-propeller protein
MFLRFLIIIGLLLVADFSQASAQDRNSTPKNVGQSASAPKTYNGQGISIEFSVEPMRSEKGKQAELLAGEEATVRFKIVETSGGKALSNLRPIAWVDQRQTTQRPASQECREKVQSFLQSSFNKRPTVDLNAYFILALNNEANISVIDPLSGFGGSKLYTLIALKSPGEDWAMSADSKRLYVSMPLVNQVAVIDIPTWQVITNIDAGVKPKRLALQHDGKYLWVGNEGTNANENGITVIDTAAPGVTAQLKTGAGPHEIVFNDDDSAAFITSKHDGTLSVIDVRRLVVLKKIKVGQWPAAIAFSSLSKTAYVANEGDGTILAIDGLRHEVVARMATEPGIRAIGIPPGGRFGLALNPGKSTVYVFDLSSNRVAHVVPVGPAADQITFTSQFAYIRSAASEFVTMIKITDLGKEAAVSRFPAGQKAPQESSTSSLANAIVAAPEEGAVLVANPADKMIYYYTEGMAAPMGSFQNYRRDPRALLVLNNSLRETERGVYTSTLRLAAPGYYDVAFMLDSPRVVNCFEMTVAENPALPKKPETAIKIEPLLKETTVRVGQPYTLRFRVTDRKFDRPVENLKDVGVLVFLAPGIWQQREWAKPLGDGVYEMSFVPPKDGVYYLFFQCPSLGLQFSQSTPLTLQTVKT